ncbi:MAG: SMI1/KNR4 family protein [Alphaproteobacteria bacterium]|nr:SMI1/KNR4 family protein [Alphaproteobacteria bacterium]
MQRKKQNLKRLIESSSIVDFAPFGEGVSLSWIEKAENYMNIKFPESYKWWLKNYSGGEVSGEEIYSVYEIDFDEVMGGDITCMYKINKENNVLSDNKIAICEPPSGDEIFFFDTSQKYNGEFPIYVLDKTNEIENKYADDFLDFLEKRINFLS